MTLALAEKIATKPAFALKATKQAVNHVQDVQGRRNAQMHAFSLHHLLHAHNELVHGMPMDPNGLPEAVREKYWRGSRGRSRRRRRQQRNNNRPLVGISANFAVPRNVRESRHHRDDGVLWGPSMDPPA